MSIPGFLRELRRRKVTRVAVVYAATAFVVVQAADIMLPRLAVPDWAVSLIVVLVLLGFPVALVLAWALELTPDGVRVTTATAHPDPAEPTPSFLGKGTVLVAGALVILGVGLGAGWFLRPAGVGPGQVSASTSPSSVAVLPFDNFGADTEDYFSDGITEDIIAQLTRIPDLTVVSRTSAMRYRNTELTVREIGSQLSVGAVLEGSVRRADGRVRIVAQLIDVASDTHLWAETYDREVQDIFAVQSEVAREIASALGRAMGPGGVGEPGAEVLPSDPETHELYLRGRHLWHSRRLDGQYSAIDYLLQAVERDPSFALGHAGLADAYLTLTFTDPTVEALDWVERAETSARRALALRPDLGEAHAALGLAALVSWDFEGADRHLTQALELTPGYHAAHHWSGVVAMSRRRYDDGLAHVRRALELDPFSARIHRDLGNGLLRAGQDREAAEVIARGMELEPGFDQYYLTALRAFSRVGREDAAFTSLLRLRDMTPSAGLLTEELRAAFEAEGIHGATRVALDRLPEMIGYHFHRATLEFDVGRTEAALASFERSVNRHEPFSAWIATDRAIVDAFRDDPRYRALLQRVGVPDR